MLNNKIPPIIIVLFFAVLMAVIAHYSVIDFTTFIFYVAVILLTTGCIFCIAGVVSFRLAKTTVNPNKPDQASALVTTGVYKISRNPMYVGFAFILAGWGVWLTSLWVLLCVLGFIKNIWSRVQRLQVSGKTLAVNLFQLIIKRLSR